MNTFLGTYTMQTKNSNQINPKNWANHDQQHTKMVVVTYTLVNVRMIIQLSFVGVLLIFQIHYDDVRSSG